MTISAIAMAMDKAQDTLRGGRTTVGFGPAASFCVAKQGLEPGFPTQKSVRLDSPPHESHRNLRPGCSHHLRSPQSDHQRSSGAIEGQCGTRFVWPVSDAQNLGASGDCCRVDSVGGGGHRLERRSSGPKDCPQELTACLAYRVEGSDSCRRGSAGPN